VLTVIKMKFRVIIIAATIFALLLALSWYFLYGKFVGRDIRNVVTELKNSGHMVIYPINEDQVFKNCVEVEEVYVIPNSIFSLIIFRTDSDCKIVSAKMGWRK
jgi:hypothetical protein